MAEARLFELPPLPPRALTVAALWADGLGWRITCTAQFVGEEGWHRSTMTDGTPLTADELVTVVASMLDALLTPG